MESQSRQKLFTTVLGYVNRQANWGNKGINMNGENLNHLKFVDDIVLITANLADAGDAPTGWVLKSMPLKLNS